MTKSQWVRWSLRGLVAALLSGPGLAAPDPTGPTKPSGDLPWQIWWQRNEPILFPHPLPLPFETRTWRDHWSREKPALLRILERAGNDAPSAAIRLGASGDPAAVFPLLNLIKKGGSQAHAAVLALGLLPDAGVEGHLAALLEDRPTGRFLSGGVDRAVPDRLRIAAALALGLTGRPRAYATLRSALRQPDLDDELGAAILIGLSFSDDPSDGLRFVECLKDDMTRGQPLTREAAAAAIGRHAAHIPGGSRLLLRVLRREPETAGRGAAVALWYADTGGGDEVGAALADAVRTSPDEVTRVLALVALAGRGDPRTDDAITRSLGGQEGGRTYALLAMGLLARARPETRELALRRVRQMEKAEPGPAFAALRLLESTGGPASPVRKRHVARIAGGNASFVGAGDLPVLLNLASVLLK